MEQNLLALPVSRLRHTLIRLLFASLVCCGMLLARFMWTGNLRFSGLFGNLLLAWIPLILAIFLAAKRRVPVKQGWDRVWFWIGSVLWLLFFPNAFYLVTDLIHMNKFGLDGVMKWFDMLMTTAFAFSGIFLGTLSLYLMHLIVRKRCGWRIGWLFAATALALGSFGIHLGRFLRLNSWDVIIRPMKLINDVFSLMRAGERTEVLFFSGAFFCFSLATYSFIISMARLHEPDNNAKAN